MKRLLIFGMFILCLSLVSCGKKEGEIKETETDEISETEETVVEEPYTYITTDYKVKDYFGGCFIVSKSNDLLYGVIDKEGNEILPIQYANVEFLNEEKVRDRKDTDFYIEAENSESYILYDKKGKKILESSEGKIEMTSCAVGSIMNNPAYFHVSDNYDEVYYDKNGNKVLDTREGELGQYSNPHKNIIVVNEEYYFATINTYAFDSVINPQEEAILLLCGMDGRVITKIEGYDYDGLNFFDESAGIFNVKLRNSQSGDVSDVEITLDGNVTWGEPISSSEYAAIAKRNIMQDVYARAYDQTETLGKRGEYTLKKESNGWYYLLDSNGQPVYDDVYYSAFKEGDAYFLSNEDDQVCVLAKNGKIAIDYGMIDCLSREEGEFAFQGKTFSDNLFCMSDFDSVCIIELTPSGGSEIYYFDTEG